MLTLYGTELSSRLLLGTARYPGPDVLEAALSASGTRVVTLSVRRDTANGRAGEALMAMIERLDLRILPNTAGCFTVEDAVSTAQMSREIFGTDWIKLEVIGREDTLQPDVVGTVDAARILVAEGFKVFPYTSADLVVAEHLLRAGCELLMPLCAPIGSGAGLLDPASLRAMRTAFPEVPLIVDAGIGRPSHAAAVMELGYDAVLLNTAVAGSGDPVAMAGAFKASVEAGRTAFEAGMMTPRAGAQASTPMEGRAVFARQAAE